MSVSSTRTRCWSVPSLDAVVLSAFSGVINDRRSCGFTNEAGRNLEVSIHGIMRLDPDPDGNISWDWYGSRAGDGNISHTARFFEKVQIPVLITRLSAGIGVIQMAQFAIDAIRAKSVCSHSLDMTVDFAGPQIIPASLLYEGNKIFFLSIVSNPPELGLGFLSRTKGFFHDRTPGVTEPFWWVGEVKIDGVWCFAYARVHATGFALLHVF